MKKPIYILGAMLFGILTYSQKKGNTENDAPANNLAVVEDGTLKIDAGGTIQVRQNSLLTVRNGITNLGDGTNFIIASEGNLIQINDLAANTGNIISERDFKIGAARNQYNYVGSPVAFAAGQTYKTIFPGSTNTTALYHNQTSNTFSTSSGANIPGRGLALKEPPATTILSAGKTTAQYKGIPQNGEIILPIANSNTALTTLGYNLVGNPYASNIDLRKLYDINGGNTNAPQITSTNISPTFYFWDNNNNVLTQQQGSGYNGQSYALFNVLTGGNGTGTAAGSLNGGTITGIKKPTKIVKVGQGFMTRSLVGSYNFKFNNSIRTDGATDVDFLGKGNANVQDDRYWLKMISPSGIASTIAIVHYLGGNNLFGAEDSRTMGGSDAIYALVENEKVAINGRSSFAVTDRVLLGSNNFVSDNYTVALEAVEGIFDTGQSIYLKDNHTGILTNLSQGNYIFTATAGENTGRFEIIYKPEATLATNSAIKEEVQVYRDAQDLVIKAQSKKITDLEVYDASGRLMLKMQPNSLKVHLSAEKLPQSIYFLKISQNGEVRTKKVLR